MERSWQVIELCRTCGFDIPADADGCPGCARARRRRRWRPARWPGSPCRPARCTRCPPRARAASTARRPLGRARAARVGVLLTTTLALAHPRGRGPGLARPASPGSCSRCPRAPPGCSTTSPSVRHGVDRHRPRRRPGGDGGVVRAIGRPRGADAGSPRRAAPEPPARSSGSEPLARERTGGRGVERREHLGRRSSPTA